MITEQPMKLKRGPKKGMKQDVFVSLADLIRQLPANTPVPVRGKWAKQIGLQLNLDSPALSTAVLQQIGVEKKVETGAEAVKTQEVSPQESSNLRLEVREIGEGDLD